MERRERVRKDREEEAPRSAFRESEAVRREAEENCTCAYPKERYGTESGHAPTCPLDLAARRRRERREMDGRIPPRGDARWSKPL